MNGSLSWYFDSDFTGFKRVTLPNNLPPVATYANQYVAKYDGKLLVFNGNVNAADNHFVNASGVLYITIADTDSGWGETYTPTQDEVKAYFLGWRMFTWNNPTNVPYNGTGTKAWAKIYCGVGGNDNGVVSGSATQTLPTTMNDQGYVPYRLIYQLATPVREPVRYEGAILLKEGKNIVELGSGMIIREKANPLKDSSGIYRLNSTYQISGGSTWFKYAAKRIFNIYRNGQPDPRWSITNDRTPDPTVNGTAEARIYNATDFDPTAAYEVSYLVLDKNTFTTNPLDVMGRYEINLNNIAKNITERQIYLETKVSTVENGLQQVFQSGVDGKAKLETAIIAKNGTVSKQGQIATFDELDAGIRSIRTSNIQSIQRGLTSISTGSTFVTVSITPVDLNKSIIIVNFCYPDVSSSTALVLGRFQSANSIIMEKQFTTSVGPVYVAWQVVEFENIKSLQRGIYTFNQNSVSMPISPIDINKSLLFVSYKTSSSSTRTFVADILARIATNDIVIFGQGGPGASESYDIHWQVVEFN